jgi:energy-coupling factor transporter ATP-binding protein EcfA2
MRVEIKRLQAQLAVTSLYVTHDQVEAMTLADRIMVMNAGVAEQVGTPLEVYRRPASIFVAGFIGAPAMNFVPGRMGADGRSVAIDGGLSFALPEAEATAGRPVTLGVRPEHLHPANEIPDATPIAFTMMQERHRFTLEHKDGLSIDISVDFVEVTHKGKKVSMPMVEMEIDHLYFGKGNKAGGTPTSIRSFESESEQKKWSKTLSGNASLNGLPRFHELADLQDKSIWSTKEQKQTEKIIDRLFPVLFPQGAKPSPQKGVAIADKLGLI